VIYGFDTGDEPSALGALLVYAIWRSRDPSRLRVTPDVWGMVERAVKSAAKRALDLNDFIERLKPKLGCSSIQPRWMRHGILPALQTVNAATGEVYEVHDERRQFWVGQLVLRRLYERTSLVVALVRDRLERERPLEARGLLKVEEVAPGE
jgi:hypothetical protein